MSVAAVIFLLIVTAGVLVFMSLPEGLTLDELPRGCFSLLLILIGVVGLIVLGVGSLFT